MRRGVHERTYRSWQNMMCRCTNPKATRYQQHGAKGITVCDRWRLYDLFLNDLGERPEGTTLDRIDNDRGYNPDNCRWSTYSEQCHNRSGWAKSGSKYIYRNGYRWTAMWKGVYLGTFGFIEECLEAQETYITSTQKDI